MSNTIKDYYDDLYRELFASTISGRKLTPEEKTLQREILTYDAKEVRRMLTKTRSGTGESDTGADVTYSLKTKALASGTNGTVASVSDADDGLATAKNVAETINQ